MDAYFTAEFANEDAALVAARESSAQTTLPNAEVTANQGALLALVAQMAGAKRVREFGTLAGYSAIWFARAVGAGGQVVSLELEPQNAAIARKNVDRAGVGDRVDIILGPAAESAERLIKDGAGPFDLVFIDADKPNNPTYLAAAIALTRPGAVIVIDNVVRNGAVLDAGNDNPGVQGVREVVRAIAADPNLDATAIQTVGLKGWDGMIVARRR
jgi:predicted O-methyltransferase YrrM